MRFTLAGFLGYLVVVFGVASAQVPSNWDQLVDDGLAADESSDYKEAARLLTQACDFSSAIELGSGRLIRACLPLTRVNLVSGKRDDASKSADRLAEVLDQLPDVPPVDQAQAWISVADVHSAAGDFDGTINALQKATNLTQGLGVTDGALALTEIATFYLPMQGREFGIQLLTAALKRLNILPAKSGLEYTTAAQKLARLLNPVEQHQEVVDLLTPLVDQAQAEAAANPVFDELWWEYQSARGQLMAAHTALGDESEADRLSDLRDTWPRPLGSGQEEAEPSTVTKKMSPSYPPGAKFFKGQGTVQLSLIVGADGRVHDVRVETPVPYGLTWEAVRAVRRWRFKSPLRDGHPVPARTEVDVVFRLSR